jgi:hypothetical protein
MPSGAFGSLLNLKGDGYVLPQVIFTALARYNVNVLHTHPDLLLRGMYFL